MKTNLKTIEQKVLKFLDSHSLINQDDKILLGLSGGADSVFAFYFLLKFKSRLKIEFACVHLNHGLRGNDSELDEKFCSELCSENNVQFFTEKRDVKTFAEKNSLSIEEAGRELRYDFFNRISEENDFSKIVTAHHLSDNVETILYNFFKGTGLKGLTGIPEKREKIIRPFLSITKEEIENYLNANGTKYRIDKSNYENDYKRNFIRNKIIPLIKKEINPSIESTLANNSEIIKSFYRLISKYLQENSNKYFLFDESKLEIYTKCIDEEGFEFFIELVKSKVKEIYDYNLSSDDYFKIKSLVENQPGKRVELKEDLTVVKNQDAVVIGKLESEIEEREIEIEIGGHAKVQNITVGIDESNVDSGKSVSEEFEIISADNLDNIFILRRWKHGDYFYPLGMKGRKKVSDFLTDLKVPSHLKKSQLVLTNNENILWVVGFRIDERFKINPRTKKALKLWKQ